MLFSFLFQISKQYTITTINPSSQYLGQEKKNILRHDLFGDKIIQNCLKIDATYYYDNDLLLRQERKKKRLHDRETNIIRIKECAHGVIVIVVGNGHSDTSSNPGRD